MPAVGTDWLTHSHGFLYTGGAFSFIDFPGATATFLPQFNDVGQAVGRWVDVAGVNHGYLSSVAAVTAPEPAGLGGLGVAARRRPRRTAWSACAKLMARAGLWRAAA